MPSKQMLRGIAAFCAVIVAAWPALAAPWTSDLEPPPALSNPVTFNGCPEDPGWPTAEQGAGRDILVNLPHDRVCQPRKGGDGKLISELGGLPGNPAHNIRVTGGQIENKWGQGPGANDKGAAGIRFTHFNGTAFVDGVVIDMRNTCEDAINTVHAAKGARVVVQNSYLTGFAQCKPGTHGDAFQNQGDGAMVELKMQNDVIDQTFQGIFVPPRYKAWPVGHGVTRLDLDHVVFRRINPPLGNTRAGFGHTMYWKQPGEPVPADGVWFGPEVWLDMPIHGLASTPAPAGFRNGCAIYTAGSGVKSGTWCYGKPPNGIPAPPDMIGLNYDRAKFTGGGDDVPVAPTPQEPEPPQMRPSLPEPGQPSKVVWTKDGDGRSILLKLRTDSARRIISELTEMLGDQQ